MAHGGVRPLGVVYIHAGDVRVVGRAVQDNRRTFVVEQFDFWIVDERGGDNQPVHLAGADKLPIGAGRARLGGVNQHVVAFRFHRAGRSSHDLAEKGIGGHLLRRLTQHQGDHHRPPFRQIERLRVGGVVQVAGGLQDALARPFRDAGMGTIVQDERDGCPRYACCPGNIFHGGPPFSRHAHLRQ